MPINIIEDSNAIYIDKIFKSLWKVSKSLGLYISEISINIRQLATCYPINKRVSSLLIFNWCVHPGILIKS